MAIINYTETFQTWSPSSPNVWEEKDLSAFIPSVGDITAEIVVATSGDVDVTYSGGVRTPGSSLDRFDRLNFARNAGGYNTTTMHVSASGGKIEHLGSSGIGFFLMGYWEGAKYVELIENFTVTGANAWTNTNLSGFGVSSGAIVELAACQSFGDQTQGFRSVGSVINRRFQMDDGDNVAIPDNYAFWSSPVQTSGATATIQHYVGFATDWQPFCLYGYWEAPPGDFTDIYDDDTANPPNDSSWDDVVVTGLPSGSIGSFLFGHQDNLNSRVVGIRESGSSLERKINGRKRQSRRCMISTHVNALDGNIETLAENVIAANDHFVLVGYWDNLNTFSPVVPSTQVSGDMFMHGHKFSAGDENKLYWTDRDTNDIRSVNLDGSDVQILVSGLSEARGLAIDTVNSQMYWLDSVSDKIQRANLDGSNVEDLISSGLNIPTDIALDVPNGKMYWTDRGTLKIQKANLDGSNIEDLITTGFDQNHGMSLDLVNNKMYWTDNGASTKHIQRANLDGSSIETLVSGLTLPESLVLDVNGNKMYWTDFGTDKIQRSDLDGSNVEDLVTTGLTTPHGITLDIPRGTMYWVDNGTDKIQKANLDGSNVVDILTTGLVFPDDIRIGPGNVMITDLFISAFEASTASSNLFVGGLGSGAVAEARALDWFTQTSDYFPQLIGTFTGASSVNIQIWDVTNAQNTSMVLSNSGCYPIGNTGRWGWSTSGLPSSQGFAQQYFYIMTSDTSETFDGQAIIDIPENARWIHPNNQDDYIRRV